MPRLRTVLSSLFATLLVLQISIPSAFAIPAFARKYGTSCMTCHAAFPKLNAFGQAFRSLGYRFPEGQDPQMVKQKPVSMGAEAYKSLWPNAVWPSDIPSGVPLAVMLDNEVTIGSRDGNLQSDFNGLMGGVELLAGGTLGDDINFLTSVDIDESGVDIEMGALGFYNILHDARLNLKIGQFPPQVLFVTNHRRFGPQYWITSATIGDNGWSLETSQKGLEANGLLAHGRMMYNVGLVEGRGNQFNAFKDPYLHVAWKIGGLPYNGVPDGSKVSGRWWGDNSLQLGAFGYLGKAQLTDTMSDPFYMTGGDFSANAGRMNLTGGMAYRNDDRYRTVDPKAVSAQTTILYTEAEYMVYPWLIPTIRYENIAVNASSDGEESRSRFAGTLQALLRANVRAYAILILPQGSGGAYRAEDVQLGLLVGF